MIRSYKVSKRKNRVIKYSKLDQLRMCIVTRSPLARRLKDLVFGIRKSLLRPL